MNWVSWWRLPDNNLQGTEMTLQQALRECNQEVLLAVLMGNHVLFEHEQTSLSANRVGGLKQCMRADLEDMIHAPVVPLDCVDDAISPWDYSTVSNVPWEVSLSLPVLFPQHISCKDRYRFLANVVWEMHAAVV